MLIWGILPLYLHAQTNTVKLKAVDVENRRVVKSATVQWKPIGTANQRWSFDESTWCGSYINERKKAYVVLVRYVGYETVTDTLKYPINKHIIRLRPNALQLNGFVVTGKSKAQVIRESSESISVITGKELQGRTISLESALNKKSD